MICLMAGALPWLRSNKASTCTKERGCVDVGPVLTCSAGWIIDPQGDSGRMTKWGGTGVHSPLTHVLEEHPGNGPIVALGLLKQTEDMAHET